MIAQEYHACVACKQPHSPDFYRLEYMGWLQVHFLVGRKPCLPCPMLSLLLCYLHAGTPAQRKRLVWASLTGVVGSMYVVGLCILMAKNPSMSPFSMLSKL
jgi:hypothetical protein